MWCKRYISKLMGPVIVCISWHRVEWCESKSKFFLSFFLWFGFLLGGGGQSFLRGWNNSLITRKAVKNSLNHSWSNIVRLWPNTKITEINSLHNLKLSKQGKKESKHRETSVCVVFACTKSPKLGQQIKGCHNRTQTSSNNSGSHTSPLLVPLTKHVTN